MGRKSKYKKTKCMSFGKNKHTKVTYDSIKIDEVDNYTYLGTVIHKSCDPKYAIKDRIERASRAVNMIQGALSTQGNINVNVALSLFNKQIIPILTYGSTFWGASECYNKLYLNNIPENVTSLLSLQEKLETKSIIAFKRVGRKSNSPRKIIATTNSLESKLWLLNNNNIITEDFIKSKFDDKLEMVHTKFCKFVLNTTKFASNHAIRAELGRYPLNITINTKLIKYWHRLENLKDNLLLQEAYLTCKENKHGWYTDIVNLLNINGLYNIVESSNTMKTEKVGLLLKDRLENQYIQLWDNKAKSSPKLEVLYSLKQNNYKESHYLKLVQNINDRKLLTKLRIGCSKLNGHKFQNQNSSLNCIYCENELEDTSHFLLKCKYYKISRDLFIQEMCSIYPSFKNLSDMCQLKCILSFKLPNLSYTNTVTENISLKCINYINKIYKTRFLE